MVPAETFTLAQLSDPHLSSLTGIHPRDLVNKRVLGYLSWRLHRRTAHRQEVLTALIRDLRDQQPDHIVICGDLTHLGLPKEFAETRDWLHGLAPPSEVTVVPGNHDAYVQGLWGRTFALWAEYMASDADGGQETIGASFDRTFPSLRVRGPIALIGISTARPSAPFLAVGRVGSDQLRKLENMLRQAGQQHLFRIVLMHHPPLPGTVGWRKRLTDGARFRAVVEQHGAELILHGHAHRSCVAQLETSVGRCPAIGVSSASADCQEHKRGAQYHIYRLTRTVEGWELLLSVRGYSPGEGRFLPQGDTHLRVHRSAVPP